MEESMIFGALGTLNEDAQEDVLENMTSSASIKSESTLNPLSPILSDPEEQNGNDLESENVNKSQPFVSQADSEIDVMYIKTTKNPSQYSSSPLMSASFPDIEASIRTQTEVTMLAEMTAAFGSSIEDATFGISAPPSVACSPPSRTSSVRIARDRGSYHNQLSRQGSDASTTSSKTSCRSVTVEKTDKGITIEPKHPPAVSKLITSGSQYNPAPPIKLISKIPVKGKQESNTSDDSGADSPQSVITMSPKPLAKAVENKSKAYPESLADDDEYAPLVINFKTPTLSRRSTSSPYSKRPTDLSDLSPSSRFPLARQFSLDVLAHSHEDLTSSTPLLPGKSNSEKVHGKEGLTKSLSSTILNKMQGSKSSLISTSADETIL